MLGCSFARRAPHLAKIRRRARHRRAGTSARNESSRSSSGSARPPASISRDHERLQASGGANQLGLALGRFAGARGANLAALGNQVVDSRDPPTSPQAVARAALAVPIQPHLVVPRTTAPFVGPVGKSRQHIGFSHNDRVGTGPVRAHVVMSVWRQGAFVEESRSPPICQRGLQKRGKGCRRAVVVRNGASYSANDGRAGRRSLKVTSSFCRQKRGAFVAENPANASETLDCRGHLTDDRGDARLERISAGRQ